MIELCYEVRDSRGNPGRLILRGGTWVGDECVFEFTETRRGVSGVVRCDWRKAEPDIEPHLGDASHPESVAMLAKIRDLMAPFHRGAFAGLTDSDFEQIYAGDYHANQNYSNNLPFESNYKQRIVDTLLEIMQPGKVLDAGCSAGEVVRQLCARGIDAWGFDLCPELEQIAYPEVADRLRQGSVTAIPFGPEDGFDTLTAFDVFEHIPETRLPAMIEEFARLGVRRIVALIALAEFQYLGHITLRPLHWWDRQFGSRYRRRTDARTMGTMARRFDADPGKYLAVYDLVQTPVLQA